MKYTITDSQGRKTVIILGPTFAEVSYRGGKFFEISTQEACELLDAAHKAGKRIE